MARKTWSIGAILFAAGAGIAARALYERFGRFEISEASMTPALRPGDYVVTERTDRPLRRGEVVVFLHPSRPDFFLVKRVIGLPGEELRISGGEVLVGGRRLDEPWTEDETGPDGTWNLAVGEAFVLGDARWLSAGDSREIGPVPVVDLNLRVVFRYWPRPGLIG